MLLVMLMLMGSMIFFTSPGPNAFCFVFCVAFSVLFHDFTPFSFRKRSGGNFFYKI
jgi:hypothetical protein